VQRFLGQVHFLGSENDVESHYDRCVSIERLEHALDLFRGVFHGCIVWRKRPHVGRGGSAKRLRSAQPTSDRALDTLATRVDHIGEALGGRVELRERLGDAGTSSGKFLYLTQKLNSGE
jgi:hypothetical protein